MQHLNVCCVNALKIGVLRAATGWTSSLSLALQMRRYRGQRGNSWAPYCSSRQCIQLSASRASACTGQRGGVGSCQAWSASMPDNAHQDSTLAAVSQGHPQSPAEVEYQAL